MRSRQAKFVLPNALHDAFIARVSELGVENASQYVLSLVRTDLASPSLSHHMFADLAHRSYRFQDKVDDEIARIFNDRAKEAA